MLQFHALAELHTKHQQGATGTDCCRTVKCAWVYVIVGWVPIFWEVRVSQLVEISTLMTKALNSVGSNLCSHYTTAPLVTNPCTHKLASPRRLCLCMRIENTSKNRKEQSRIADEWLAHKVGVLQTECRRNCSWWINLSKTHVKWWRLLNIKGLGSWPNPRMHP
jgi:hypothetical protein